MQNTLDVGYQAQTPGTDEHAGEEVAENSAEAKLAGEHNCDGRCCKIDRGIVKYHMDMLRRGVGFRAPIKSTGSD